MDALDARLGEIALAGPSIDDTTRASCDGLELEVGTGGLPTSVTIEARPAAGSAIRWTVLSAAREMSWRKAAATHLLTGAHVEVLADPGPPPAGVELEVEDDQGRGEFEQLLAEARAGQESARTALDRYLSGGTVVVFSADDPVGPVIATVDTDLLVRGLRMRSLRGADQQVWWLLRAAGIAHLAWEQNKFASILEDLPQFSDQLPGQPAYSDLAQSGTIGWPAEDPQTRVEREEFLSTAEIRTPDGKVV